MRMRMRTYSGRQAMVFSNVTVFILIVIHFTVASAVKLTFLGEKDTEIVRRSAAPYYEASLRAIIGNTSSDFKVELLPTTSPLAYSDMLGNSCLTTNTVKMFVYRARRRYQPLYQRIVMRTIEASFRHLDTEKSADLLQHDFYRTLMNNYIFKNVDRGYYTLPYTFTSSQARLAIAKMTTTANDRFYSTGESQRQNEHIVFLAWCTMRLQSYAIMSGENLEFLRNDQLSVMREAAATHPAVRTLPVIMQKEVAGRRDNAKFDFTTRDVTAADVVLSRTKIMWGASGSRHFIDAAKQAIDTGADVAVIFVRMADGQRYYRDDRQKLSKQYGPWHTMSSFQKWEYTKRLDASRRFHFQFISNDSALFLNARESALAQAAADPKESRLRLVGGYLQRSTVRHIADRVLALVQPKA